jgi:benzylsuccinate CoA-transferase BbsF subunit
MSNKPFENVNIIDFAWGGVAPFIITLLGQLGATIVRVESAKRPDPVRMAPPFAVDLSRGEVPGLNHSGLFSGAHQCPKYSMLLDLGNDKARQVFKRLVAWADVFIESFTTEQIEKWELSYEELVKIKPDIIMLSTCGFGNTGPLHEYTGFGFTLSAMSGLYGIAGWPDRPAYPLSSYYSDMLAALNGASVLVAAIDYQRRTGKGQCIDQSQIEASIDYLAPLVLDYSGNSRLVSRNGNKINYASPHGTYRCKGDDRWIAIAVFSDEEWNSFCRVLGNSEWIKDPRFSTLRNRVNNSDELDRLVNERTINFDAVQLMKEMQDAGVSAGLVLDGKDLTEDPQLNVYEYYREIDHPYLGKHGSYHPPNFTLTEAVPTVTSPVILGEHTEYVATKIIGMSDEEFVRLYSEGVFA